MGMKAAWIALAVLMAAPAALAQATTSQVPPAAAKPAAYRRFVFTHLVFKVPDGTVYANYRVGALCLGHYTKAWTGGQGNGRVSPALAQTVQNEVRAAGLNLTGDSDNIFERDQAETTVETELGAIVTQINLNYCLRPNPTNVNASFITGSAAMSVEWQVYDKLSKTVLGTINTAAEYDLKTPTAGNDGALSLGALRENAKKLAMSDAFRAALLTPESHDLAASPSSKQNPIALSGSLAAGVRPVADAVGAVVLIAAGQAEGSGFLVSQDGLLLTDRHVVGDAKYVKVRWSDGLEALGEVVRADKVRDVALVKTDARGRKPLALRHDPLQPGDTVFAIGAPMGDRFQSTVTRGVLSAYRTFDGLSYIQSDVNVTHGSSGGPLLDEKGEVVGITVLGYQPTGAPLGINLFTPVPDALAFLSAKPG
jgi:S1-C subfamily serine protease